MVGVDVICGPSGGSSNVNKKLQKILKGQSDVSGDDAKAEYFRAQVLESQNMQVLLLW